MADQATQEFTFRPATRQASKLLVCFYAESGCGKTYSALLLARGFAGPAGRIGMVDTEAGRGELYAPTPNDPTYIAGPYEVTQMAMPFSPLNYVAALHALETAGVNVGIIDSGSHEWEGIGGVLDMVNQNEEKGRKGWHNWIDPKMDHTKYLLALTQTSIPLLIICLRAKHKSKQVKDAQGKTQIVRDDFTSPLQSDEFIFVATIHGEIMPDHSLRVTKSSLPSLASCFPNGSPVTIEHGRLLAEWCNASVTVPAALKAPAPTGPPADDLKALKKRLWDLLEPVRGDERTWLVAEAWLANHSILSRAIAIKDLSIESLREVIDKTEIELGNLGL